MTDERHTCDQCGLHWQRGERYVAGDPTSDWWCLVCIEALIAKVMDLMGRMP